MMTLLKSAVKNKIFWYIASRYGVMGLQFLTTIFIAVKLGAYYFGIWSFIILLTTIGGQFNWGIGTAVTVLCVQHKEDEQKCLDYIFNSLCLVLFTAVLPAVITAYDRFFGIPLFEKYHLNNLIYAICLLVILQYFANLFINIFRFRNKLIEVMIQQTLWPILMFCLIFCATGKTLLFLLVSGYVFASLLALAIFVYRSRKECFKGHFSARTSRELFRKGFFLFLFNACFFLIVLSTKTMISSYYPVEEFGYFSFAFALANGVNLLLESFLFLVTPKVIDLLKGNDFTTITSTLVTLRKNYMIPLYLLFYAVLPCRAVFFHFLPKYQASFLPFLLILFTLISYSICFGYSTLMIAQNKEKLLALLVGGALLLNIVSVYVLIKIYSVTFEYAVLGTAITYLIYSSVVNAIALRLLKNFSWKVLLKESFPACQSLLWIITFFMVLAHLHPVFLLIPLLLYIVLNLKELRIFLGNVRKLIKNESLINI